MTETGTLVRQRRADDLDAAARALVAVHATDGYPVEGVADPNGWLQPATLIRAWVAEVDEEIVGPRHCSDQRRRRSPGLARAEPGRNG